MNSPLTKQPEEVMISEDNFIYCPRCNMNMFSPLFIYAALESKVIGQPPALGQTMAAFQCCGCQQVIPYEQFKEFTKAKLAAAASAQTPETETNVEEKVESVIE